MAGNEHLGHAKAQKKDEFYTQLKDIENELAHYRAFFKGKTVLCNCDDPYESNFFKYFAMNFNMLGLKKLVSTCYVTSPVNGSELTYYVDSRTGQLSFLPEAQAVPLKTQERRPYRVEICEVGDENGDGRIDLADVEYLIKNRKNVMKQLEGDGDFRSEECIELLKEADVVVTNPPFSLFREYVAQLVEYGKKFLIIGNQNAITYKEIFPLLKNNQMWLGYGFPGNVGFFGSPYEDTAVSSQHKEGKIRISGVMWFTNIDMDKRHEPMILYRNYTPEAYPHYDNYDAIEVSKTADIPCDYDGVMGVPITFLDKYCPEQFEMLGMCENLDLYGLKTRIYTAQECHDRYFELFGKKGTYDLNAAGVINGKKTYQRLLIRRKAATE